MLTFDDSEHHLESLHFLAMQTPLEPHRSNFFRDSFWINAFATSFAKRRKQSVTGRRHQGGVGPRCSSTPGIQRISILAAADISEIGDEFATSGTARSESLWRKRLPCCADTCRKGFGSLMSLRAPTLITWSCVPVRPEDEYGLQR